MAFLSYELGKNFFDTLPIDVVYLLEINAFNLTQTAYKMFFFLAPGIALIILFLILSSFILRSFLKLVFTALIRSLQSL